MRRLRGIAASARVLHSPTSGRTTTLQELPTGGLEGGAAAAAGGGLAADASTSSSYGSLSSSGSSEGGGFPGSPGFSFPLVSRDPLFEDDEEEQQARDLMRRWKETRSHLKIEKSELLRSVLLFINVVAQIVLTVVALEYQWDGQTLKNSSVSVGLRTAISALTVVLVIQMVEDDAWKIWKDAKDMRKRAKHAKEDRKKGRFAAAMGEARRQLTHRRFYLPLGEPTDYSFHTPTWMILMEYLPLRFYLLFTLRVLLCLPHIAPFLNDEFTKLAAMLTFLKLFVLMSVLRHFNPIYRNRHLIIRIPGSSLLEMPRFTTWFSTRTFYHQYPLTFSLSNIIAVVTTTAYGMYIYEREAQPHVFNYKLCLVIAVENLITGWPGDVFSQYTLESDGGRTFSIFASLGGLFFFALLINFLYIKLSPSSNDSHVVDWIARLKLEDKEKHEAAKLIQLVWRHRVDRRKREEEQVVNGDHERHYRFITVPSEKAYQVRFRRQCREMRHVRRKLVELYGRTGDGLETHPPPAAEKTKKKKKKMKRKSSKDKTKGKGRRHSHSGHVHSSLYKHSLRIIPTKLEFEGLEQQGAIDVGGQLSQEDSMNSDSSRDSFALVERQHEWEIQRARLRTYYAKAAKNLNKLMDELDR